MPRQQRMAGGVNASIEEFPFLVALEFSGYKSESWEFMCGGSIITPYNILTAAHCIENSDDPSWYRVRAGSSLLQKHGTIYKVSNWTRHEKFRVDNHSNTEYDIAVLKLMEPIEFDNKTKMPVDMFEFNEESKPGSIAKVAGWGQISFTGEFSEHLRSGELKLVDKKNCSEAYRDIDGFQDGEICAVSSDVNKVQSLCGRDSGNPLIINGRLAGIHVHSESCPEHSLGSENFVYVPSKYPDVFTEVAYFRKWIDHLIKG